MLVNQMEGKIDSWAVRWCYHLFKNDLMTVYPRTSKALNIGLDGSGTHCHQAFGLEKISQSAMKLSLCMWNMIKSWRKKWQNMKVDRLG